MRIIRIRRMPGCCAVGSAPALGAGGPEFESLHSDQTRTVILVPGVSGLRFFVLPESGFPQGVADFCFCGKGSFGFVKLAGVAGFERHVAGIWDSHRCRMISSTNRYGGVKDAFFPWLDYQLCMQCVFQKPLLSAAREERDGSCRILYFFPGLWYNKSISPRSSEKE